MQQSPPAPPLASRKRVRWRWLLGCKTDQRESRRPRGDMLHEARYGGGLRADDVVRQPAIQIASQQELQRLRSGGQGGKHRPKARRLSGQLSDTRSIWREGPNTHGRWRRAGKGYGRSPLYLRFAWHGRVLPQDREVSGWSGAGQGSLRDRPGSTDDRRCTLGIEDEAVVRHDQGRKRTLPEQPALG